MQIWGRCHLKGKLIIHEGTKKAWHGLGQVVASLNKQSFEILFMKTAGSLLNQ